MKRFSALTMIVLVALALGASTAMAQTPAPKPPPTYEQVIVNTWKNLHNKILAMAKDTEYPDAKLGWKPHPDSRSVLDELRHVTIGLEMTTAVAKGEKFDFGAPREDGRRQAADARLGGPGNGSGDCRVIPGGRGEANPAADWLARSPGRALRQAGDAYRVNGIVPPISRPKK